MKEKDKQQKTKEAAMKEILCDLHIVPVELIWYEFLKALRKYWNGLALQRERNYKFKKSLLLSQRKVV